MGAKPYDGGVSFRVWAPHAEAVYVGGSFNEWNGEMHPLAQEENGYWSVDVSGVSAGDAYKYRIVNGDVDAWKNDPYARVMTNSAGDSIVYDPGAFDWGDDGHALPAFNEVVLYELHVGTFNDPDPDDDRPATFDDAVGRLAYLCELGVNAVCLMPIVEFPGDYSWGYNPAHPFAVEASYGGADGLKRFIKAAHERGLGVVLDVVYNHFGPSDIDLWRFDGWGEDAKGGIYFYNDDRADTPWGETRPDYGRPEVRRYIRDNVMMWIEEFRVDGLRWDGTVFIRRTSFDGGQELPDGWQMMQEITAEVRDRYPQKLLIAEDLQRDPAVTTPPGDGGAGFHAQWDTEFVYPLRERVITPPDDNMRSVDAVEHALTNSYGDAFARVIYVESHDNAANGHSRLVDTIDPERGADAWYVQKRVALGAALTLTAPGIPMLFQGQEFLEDDWFSDTDPLDWSRCEAHSGLLRLHRDLVRLRRNLDGRTRGLQGQNIDVFHQNREAKVVAYRRWLDGGPGDETVVVVNLRADAYETYELAFPSPGTWHCRFNSDWQGYSEAFTNAPALDVEVDADADCHAEVALAPYAVLIYSQEG